MSLAIVEAVGPDVDRWWALRRTALQSDPAAFACSARDRTTLPSAAWIARVDGAPVGIVGLEDSSAAELVSMWVAPEVRGRGVGRALVQVVVDRAQGTEIRLRVMADNLGGIDFYRSMGFVFSTETPDAEGTLVMERRLDARAAPTAWPAPAARPRRPGASPPEQSADQ